MSIDKQKVFSHWFEAGWSKTCGGIVVFSCWATRQKSCGQTNRDACVGGINTRVNKSFAEALQFCRLPISGYVSHANKDRTCFWKAKWNDKNRKPKIRLTILFSYKCNNVYSWRVLSWQVKEEFSVKISFT